MDKQATEILAVLQEIAGQWSYADRFSNFAVPEFLKGLGYESENIYYQVPLKSEDSQDEIFAYALTARSNQTRPWLLVEPIHIPPDVETTRSDRVLLQPEILEHLNIRRKLVNASRAVALSSYELVIVYNKPKRFWLFDLDEEACSQIYELLKPPDSFPRTPLPTMSPYKYDAFISHAGEDRDEIAEPLAETLSQMGLQIWYDDFELRVGDSLTESINVGLAKSRYGIVIVSDAFFDKNWTQYELRGLTQRDTTERTTILPLKYDISIDEIRARHPALADKLMINIHTGNIQEVAEDLLERISNS